MSAIEKESKNIKGGVRPGAGRKKGTPNKRTTEQSEAVAATGITPLEFMLKIMRDDKNDPKDRLAAANMAAPFVHAKLSSIELNAKVAVHEESLDDLA